LQIFLSGGSRAGSEVSDISPDSSSSLRSESE
jgi:hypothetical protein